MAEADAVQLAREQIDAFSAGDWQRMRASLSPQAVYNEVGTGRRIEGVEPILQAFQGWRQTFPDAKGTITSALGSGNTAALEITWEGTQTGPLVSATGSIPASGKKVTVQAAQVVTVEGGKVKETRHYFDMMGMLAQMGATPR